MTSWGSVLMLYKHWCGYFWSSWTKWSSSTLSSISRLWNKASNYRPGYRLSSFLTWLTPDDHWKVDECSESNTKKSAARNHLKDGKSVRSCFECVFSQIIRLLQGCSITTSKIALKRWTDGPHNVKTLRKCSENQSCRACSCYSNECWSISVTSTQNCFRSCSIQSIPGKQIGLLYVLAQSGMLWWNTAGDRPPSPAMLGCLIWDLAAKLGRKTALALRSHKQDIQDTLSQYTHIGSEDNGWG